MIHPSPDILAGYADGSLSEGMTLLVASHLTFCPACRDSVERFEALGGAMISAEPLKASKPSLDAVLQRLDHSEDAPLPSSLPADAASIMPKPLRNVVGGHEDDIRWRFLLPGLSEHKIDGFGEEEVSLLRAKPGVRILPHTHSGQEATLVLSGALQDGDVTLTRGDVAVATEEHNHRPEITGDDVCICMIVLSGRMQFTGPIGRALNLFSR